MEARHRQLEVPKPSPAVLQTQVVTRRYFILEADLAEFFRIEGKISTVSLQNLHQGNAVVLETTALGGDL